MPYAISENMNIIFYIFSHCALIRFYFNKSIVIFIILLFYFHITLKIQFLKLKQSFSTGRMLLFKNMLILVRLGGRWKAL